MLAFTHLVFAFALANLTGKNQKAAVLFAFLPEIDILVNQITPFVRNGIFHSLLLSLVVVFLIQVTFSNTDITYGAFTGLSSHLLLDLFSFERIMLLFPLKEFYSLSLFPSYGLMENLAIISLSFLILLESQNPTVSEPLAHKVYSVLTLE